MLTKSADVAGQRDATREPNIVAYNFFVDVQGQKSTLRKNMNSLMPESQEESKVNSFRLTDYFN